MSTFCENDNLSSQEKYFFYNTLAILIKAVIGHKTTVDLRNESTVYGTVEHADAYMNITMKDCYFVDPRGDSHKYDMFFVHTRNIRSVHIPPHLRIIPTITKELQKVKQGNRLDKRKVVRSLKGKRAQEKHARDALMAKEIREKKNQDTPSTSQI